MNIINKSHKFKKVVEKIFAEYNAMSDKDFEELLKNNADSEISLLLYNANMSSQNDIIQDKTAWEQSRKGLIEPMDKEEKKMKKVFRVSYEDSHGNESFYDLKQEGIVKIEEHQPQGEGDQWFYDVFRTDGTIERLFRFIRVIFIDAVK